MERDRDRLDDFKQYGYGGNVSDALYNEFDVGDTVLADRFTPLETGMKGLMEQVA